MSEKTSTKITVTADGCVKEADMIKLRKHKKTMMQVESRDEIFVRPIISAMLVMRKGCDPVRMFVDAVTGTIYHPKNGQSMSSALRLLGAP